MAKKPKINRPKPLTYMQQRRKERFEKATALAGRAPTSIKEVADILDLNAQIKHGGDASLKKYLKARNVDISRQSQKLFNTKGISGATIIRHAAGLLKVKRAQGKGERRQKRLEAVKDLDKEEVPQDNDYNEITGEAEAMRQRAIELCKAINARYTIAMLSSLVSDKAVYECSAAIIDNYQEDSERAGYRDNPSFTMEYYRDRAIDNKRGDYEEHLAHMDLRPVNPDNPIWSDSDISRVGAALDGIANEFENYVI